MGCIPHWAAKGLKFKKGYLRISEQNEAIEIIQSSGESKVLVSFWVWPSNMHAPYILSADNLDDFSGTL